MWNASTDNLGVAGYKIRQDGMLVGDVPDNGFTSSGLTGNTSFRYTVQAYDAAGNASGESSPLLVVTDNEPPSASFSWSAKVLNVDFTDSSIDSDGNIVTWFWDLGDKNSSTLQNPSHSFTSAGTYNVTLTVTDDHGGESSTSQDLTVFDDRGPVRVELQQGLSGYAGAEDSYVASGSPSSNWGSSAEILADGDDRRNRELVSLLKWDVSLIPAGVTVTNAFITLQVFNSSNRQYDLWEMLAGWNEAGATWDNTQPVSNRGSLVGSFNPTSTGSFTIDLDAKGIALVQSWIEGAANNGISVASGGTLNGIDMRSSEYNKLSQRPMLTITYK